MTVSDTDRASVFCNQKVRPSWSSSLAKREKNTIVFCDCFSLYADSFSYVVKSGAFSKLFYTSYPFAANTCSSLQLCYYFTS